MWKCYRCGPERNLSLLLLASCNYALAGSIPGGPEGKSQLVSTKDSRSTFPQLRLKNRNLLSTTVGRQGHSCSTGWKIATFTYKSCTRSAFPRKLARSTRKKKKRRRKTKAQTCAEQLPQSTRAKRLTQSNLHRAMCAELSTRSNLHRAIAQATCADQLAQSTCEEQLAKNFLTHRICAGQLAQSEAQSTHRD